MVMIVAGVVQIMYPIFMKILCSSKKLTIELRNCGPTMFLAEGVLTIELNLIQ
jgi:hypothetical protein